MYQASKQTLTTYDIGTVFKRRKTTYGWIKDTTSPNHFCKVVLAPRLDLLPVPAAFRPYLDEVLGDITGKRNTGCIWTITVADVNGRACLVKGWPAFAIAHGLDLGYLVMFKKLGRMEYKVIIFDNSGCEVVRPCPEHPLNFKKDEDC